MNLVDLDLPEKLIGAAAKYHVSASDVTFEITETGLPRDPGHVLDVLTRLGLKRFQLSIVDFGTGHSSLACLSKMPFRELKIDKMLVDDCDTNRENRIIMMNMIELAQKSGLRVVAEGIETPVQLDVLTDLHCDQGQGYLFSKPMLNDDFSHWYKSQ